MTFAPANKLLRSSERGAWWLRDGRWYPYETFAFGSKAMQHAVLGLVAMQISPQRVRLSWDVDHAEPTSLAEALDHLERLDLERLDLERPGAGREIVLAFNKDGWARESFETVAGARARVRQVARYQGIGVVPRTQVRRLDLDELAGAHPVLRQAMACWRAGGLDTPWPATPAAGSALVLSYDGGPPTFSYVGLRSEATRRLGLRWRSRSVGSRAQSAIPDSTYNRRVDAGYRQAMEEKAPVFDHVLAHIDDAREAEWLPYQRLTLPTRDGVAVFTKVTPDISLRLLEGAA